MSSSTKFVQTTASGLAALGFVAVAAAFLVGSGFPPAEATAATIEEGAGFSAGAEETTTTMAAEESTQVVLGVSEQVAVTLADSMPLASKFATPAVLSVSKVKHKQLRLAPSASANPKKAVKRAAPRKRARIRAGAWRSARVSWYGPGFYGNTMAGGGKLTRSSVVVAHRSLPFGTKVQFTYRGRSVIAVVKDRGPYVSGRTFDLGPGTAKRLGFGGVGVVKYRIIGRR